MTETDSILPDLSGDGAATGAALANDTAPELPPLAIAPPRFMPPRPDDPSGENAPPDQAEPRPTIDIEYPHPPAGDRTQGEPGIGNDPGFAITPKNPAGGNIDPGFDITPKNLPVSPYPQGRLADPIQR